MQIILILDIYHRFYIAKIPFVETHWREFHGNPLCIHFVKCWSSSAWSRTN